MDKGISEGGDHRVDPQTRSKGSAHQPLISAASRSSGAAHKGAQFKYTIEFNVVHLCNVKRVKMLCY